MNLTEHHLSVVTDIFLGIDLMDDDLCSVSIKSSRRERGKRRDIRKIRIALSDPGIPGSTREQLEQIGLTAQLLLSIISDIFVNQRLLHVCRGF